MITVSLGENIGLISVSKRSLSYRDSADFPIDYRRFGHWSRSPEGKFDSEITYGQ